jgi:hypothetical protein
MTMRVPTTRCMHCKFLSLLICASLDAAPPTGLSLPMSDHSPSGAACFLLSPRAALALYSVQPSRSLDSVWGQNLRSSWSSFIRAKARLVTNYILKQVRLRRPLLHFVFTLDFEPYLRYRSYSWYCLFLCGSVSWLFQTVENTHIHSIAQLRRSGKRR